MLSIRTSRFCDVIKLSTTLREADYQELLAAGSPSPKASLYVGLKYSKKCFTLTASDDTPVAMFGVAEGADPLVGLVWMLCTDHIKNHPTQFLKGSRVWLEELHKDFPLLTNKVDARNTVHISWLSWLGFSFLRTVPGEGPDNLPFYEFARISTDV